MEQSHQYLNDKILLYNENIKDFIKRDPQIPMCQRQFIDERVNEIYEKIVKDQNKEYIIPYLGFIHCGMYNRKIYILDGQHRYRAYQKYYKEHDKNFRINYVLKMCSTEKELRDFFKDLNNNYNPHDMILNDKDLDTTGVIKKHIKNKYSEHISSSENPRLSNINLDKVCTHFIKLCPCVTNPIEIIDNFEQLNDSLKNEYSLSDKENIKKIVEDSDKKQKLYISLLFIKDVEIKKRNNIPSSLRNKLWNQEIGSGKMDGKCYVCGLDVMFTNFHAGHLISVKNGGTDNITNLKVLCPLCNMSMSSKNLEDFKLVYF